MKKLETELKLSYKSRQELFSIPNKKWFRKYLLPDAPVQSDLISSYLDTPNRTFRKNGAVVRVRSVDGNEYIHTVKVSSGGNDGLHQRYEWNYKTNEENFSVSAFLKQAKADHDPYSVLQKVLEPAGAEELVTVLQTRFNRTAYLSGFGDSILEVALDYGEICAGDQHETICEMEIELLEGDVRDLLSLGQIVMAKSNGVPENTSKYGRGIDLLELEVKNENE